MFPVFIILALDYHQIEQQPYLQPCAAIDEFMKLDCGKYPRIFADCCGYLLNRSRRSGHKRRENGSFAAPGTGTALADSCFRGQRERIESIFSRFSFDRNPCVLTRLEIGANMKKIANFLMPFAAIVLVATCLISFFSLLVISMESIGLAGGVPWSYYQRLNIGLISVALPVVGMLLFAVILLGLRGKDAEAAKPAVIEGAIKLPMMERKKEENRVKAAA
jgi:hypothetical protein